MKNEWYKTKIFAIAILIFASVAYAAGVPETILSDSIILGKGSSTDAKEIEFNTGDSPSNVKMTVDDSKNGTLSTNQLTLGDGTATAQSLIFNQTGTDVRIDVNTSQAVGVLTNSLTFGSGTAVDQKLTFDRGASNPFIKWDEASSKLVIANDGSTEEAIVTGAVGNEASLLDNIGSSTSVASSALTINLKQADGSTDPTSPSPDRISFRSSTAGTGGYNIRSVAAALSIVVPSGATLGHTDGADAFVYVYALDNAGTVELAVSSAVKDESSLQTSLTIGMGSDDDDFYSTTGRSNVPIRLLLRLKSNQTTAGTWDLNVIENSPDAPTFTDINNKKIEYIAGGINQVESRAKLLCSGSSSITSNTGGWISSIGNISTGICVISYDSGKFSGDPDCDVGTVSTPPLIVNVSAPPTSGSVSTRCQSNAGADCASYTIEIVCKGDKP